MKSIVHTVTFASLLHDIGKVISRSRNEEGSSHSILGSEFIKKFTDNKLLHDCIRYHHKQDIANSLLVDSNPSYIVYIANNISSGLDRVDIEDDKIEDFDKNRHLDSIYNRLNNNSGKSVHRPSVLKGQIKYPSTKVSSSLSTEYGEILDGLTKGIIDIQFEPDYINSMLQLMEIYMSYIPSSTHDEQIADISLYDHSKTTAALAACITAYLEALDRTNYRMELFERETGFLDEKAFCMFSLDISGVQKFIYSISSKSALKSLRTRSFYLELLLENTVDEILESCYLSRTNLLYTGGGHAYLLLPNTKHVIDNIKRIIKNINSGLMDLFGSELYIAYGLQACSANELMSKTDDPESYMNIFRSLSTQISAMKLRRYSPEDIRRLNTNSEGMDERECSICGVSSKLIESDSGVICEICSMFARISSDIIKDDVVLAVLRNRIGDKYLPLVSGEKTKLYLQVMPVSSIQDMINDNRENLIRFYRINESDARLTQATRLWMGDYCAKNEDGSLKTFEELAQESVGIKRIGVLCADVDNLGNAFVNGFIREHDLDNKYRYVTISRTTTLSRSLSIFFRYYINDILVNPSYSYTGKDRKGNIVIVYSGGDDMFIVGAWDEVISAAIEINKCFAQYTGNTLTMSAGLAVFDVKYPISRMAIKTAELEGKAKNYSINGKSKNSISLFGLEYEKGHLIDRHTYDWTTFENKVLDEKYKTLDRLFKMSNDYGMTFLYNILDLLRQADNDSINIARLAYLLARKEPNRRAPRQYKESYSNFVASIYNWALDTEERRQLITAILILIYNMRDQ